MDPSAETRIRKVLEPGEELLWTGKPQHRVSLDDPKKLRVVVIGSISAVGMLGTLFYLADPDKSGRHIQALAESFFGGAVLLLIVAILAVQFLRWLELEAADSPVSLKQSWFFLTDRRAAVIPEDPQERVRAVRLDSFVSLRTEVHDDGRGSVHCMSSDRDWWSWDYVGNPVECPLFTKIEQPQLVHETIMRAIGSPSGRGPYQIEYAWERRLRELLPPREHLVWSGRPQQSRSNDRSSLAPSLLALPFFILPAYLVREAVASRDPRREGIGAVSDLQLKAIIAVAVVAMAFGLYVLVLRFFVDAWRVRRTSYGLTGSRAIVRKPGIVRSAPISSISSVGISDESGSRGSIRCRCEVMERCIQLGRARWTIKRSYEGLLFADIESPQAVHSIFTDVITGAKGGSAPLPNEVSVRRCGG